VSNEPPQPKFVCSVTQTQKRRVTEKLMRQSQLNMPLDVNQSMYPDPDKHLINLTRDRVHTTRRAQVLGQDVLERQKIDGNENPTLKNLTKLEKVFISTNPKPLETNTTFPEQLLNSENNINLFLKDDRFKAQILRNFKRLNRDLIRAYLRQMDSQAVFTKKGRSVAQVPDSEQKEQDELTFKRVSSLFGEMVRRQKTADSSNLSEYQAALRKQKLFEQ